MNRADSTIPRRPLLWLATALLFTVPPMFGNLVWWVPASFLATLIAKLWMEWHGYRLRSLGLKLVFAAAGLGCVKLGYHTLVGLEPGLSIYILLISIKILEAHTARDFHVVALLGWFLGLAGLFVSQNLGAGLYAAATFCLVLTGVVQFHRGVTSRRVFVPPLRSSLALMLQSLPLAAVLFFLFPRGSGSFRFELKRSFFNKTGMSEHLSPGSVASLALSNEVAFRTEFVDGNVPRPSSMYWRGGVLMECDGLTWSPLNFGIARRPEPAGGEKIRQRIIIQPSGGQWVFGLDWPVKNPGDSTRMLVGNVIRANKNIYSPRLYEVTSCLVNQETELSAIERKACLQLPGDIPERVSALAESWSKDGAGTRTVVTRAMQFFRKENFRYSLSPGEYSKAGLDDFLFRRRVGFCEHYAAAFATLMRLAGIPTRVVVGYQGGQFNSLGGYLVVRQSDAHAWCEVWNPGKGWERADPTAAVAPGRVDLGFDSFMNMTSANATGTAAAGDPRAAGAWGRQPLFRKLQLAWDTVSYEWDAHVLNFDEDAQQTFFLNLGFIDTRPLRLLGWLVFIGVFVLCVQSLWAWWKTRVAPDRIRKLYDRFCRSVRTLGVEREPWEGPRHFSDRAAQQIPAHAEHIRQVADLYISLRYAPDSDDLKEIAELERKIDAFGKPAAAGK